MSEPSQERKSKHMSRLYHYVGPLEIRSRVGRPTGLLVSSCASLRDWLLAPERSDGEESLSATFVINATADLLVADRRSEHVACAGGGPVLSAGEMFFVRLEDNVEVLEVSNQSTGYCPEPESWPTVAAALDRLGVGHPGRFTMEVVFRRCPGCGERNIVKDGWFVCGACGAELPEKWNFGA
jgi:hypothetical protein